MTDQELDILLSEEFQNYLKEDPFDFELNEEVLNEGKFLNTIRWKLAKFSLRFLSNKSLDDFFSAYYAKNGQPTEESKRACARSRREKIKHIRLLCDKLPQEVKDRIIQSPQAKQCEKAAAVSGISTAITGVATGVTVARAAQATTNYFAAKEAEKAKQIEAQRARNKKDETKEDIQKEDEIKEDIQKEDEIKEDIQKEDETKEDIQKEDETKEDIQKEDETKEDIQKEKEETKPNNIEEKTNAQRIKENKDILNMSGESLSSKEFTTLKNQYMDNIVSCNNTNVSSRITVCSSDGGHSMRYPEEMLTYLSQDERVAFEVIKDIMHNYGPIGTTLSNVTTGTLKLTVDDNGHPYTNDVDGTTLLAMGKSDAYSSEIGKYYGISHSDMNSILSNVNCIQKDTLFKNSANCISIGTYEIDLGSIASLLRHYNSRYNCKITGLSESYLLEKFNKQTAVTGFQLFGSALSVLASFIFPQLWAVWIVAGIQVANTGIGVARTGSMAHKATTIRRDEIVDELMKNKSELKESIFHTEGMNLLMEQTVFEDACESNAEVAATIASKLINKTSSSAPETILTLRNDEIIKEICNVDDFVQRSTREFGRAAFSKKLSLREAILSVFKLNLVLGTKYSLHDIFQNASIKGDTESTFVEYSGIDFSKVINYKDTIERSANAIKHCLFDNLFDKAILTKYLPTLYFIACT